MPGGSCCLSHRKDIHLDQQKEFRKKMPDIPYYLISLSVAVILLAGIVVFWKRNQGKKKN
jgi:hypothetical protein